MKYYTLYLKAQSVGYSKVHFNRQMAAFLAGEIETRPILKPRHKRSYDFLTLEKGPLALEMIPMMVKPEVDIHYLIMLITNKFLWWRLKNGI